MPAKPSSRDLANSVVMNAIRLTRTLRALNRSGHLTGPEISALAIIVHGERIAARDLAAYEEVTPATISRLVAAMEEKGLVKRTADKADSRLQWISATPLGVKRIREGHEKRIAPLSTVIEALPTEKRKQLEAATAILEEVIAAVQANKS